MTTSTDRVAPSRSSSRVMLRLAAVSLALLLGACQTIKPAVGPGAFGAIGRIQPMAENGHSGAQNLLGVMYFKGDEVPRSYDAAIRWWTLAATQGDPDAQYNLGYLYADSQRRTTDPVLAHMWLTIADENGDSGAAGSLDGLEARMTPRQIRESRALAQIWLEQTEL